MLIFLGKVTGALSCLIDRFETAVCDSDTQQEDSSEESSDAEEDEISDDLYHHKEAVFRLARFIASEKFKAADFFIPSHLSLEITSPPPEVSLPNC